MGHKSTSSSILLEKFGGTLVENVSSFLPTQNIQWDHHIFPWWTNLHGMEILVLGHQGFGIRDGDRTLINPFMFMIGVIYINSCLIR